MFLLRGMGVSLAIFILAYGALSLLVIGGQNLAVRTSRRLPPRFASDLLFAWRILPLVFSICLTLLYVVPSFVIFEPHHTDERFGADLALLGFCCVSIVGAGLFRAFIAQRQITHALSHWLNGAKKVGSTEAIPVYRTGTDAPALTVAGVCSPRVLVSETAASLLTDSELNTALKHEVAHVRRRDNLKKLLFRFSVFPWMSNLEVAWSDAAEMAADDAAVTSVQDALDLASALIKLSRYTAGQPMPALSSGFLHSSAASLAARVERLFAWTTSVRCRQKNLIFYVLPAVAIAAICGVSTYGTLLAGMHTATEWLVR